MISAAILVIRAGRIIGVDLGTVELSAGLRWGDTKVRRYRCAIAR